MVVKTWLRCDVEFINVGGRHTSSNNSLPVRQRFWGSAADRRLVVRVAIGLISHRSVLPRGEPAVGDVFVSSVKGPPATSFGHFGKNI